jgi:hypothetical protein
VARFATLVSAILYFALHCGHKNFIQRSAVRMYRLGS